MRGKKRVRPICQPLQRLMTGFVVIWLVLFYPATCQYHGLLLPFGLLSTNHDQHESVEASPKPVEHARQQHQLLHHHASTALPGESTQCEQRAIDSFVHHRTLPAAFAAMMLLTMAMASCADLLAPASETSLFIYAAPLTHQHQTKPPDRPPRLLLIAA